MDATLEKREGNTVGFRVEVKQERVEEALDSAYRTLVRDVEIPGFRKGKAPRPIFERFVGTAPLYEEAIDDLLPQCYAEAVEELKLEPVARPEVDIVQFGEDQPLIFDVEVEVKPQPEVGDYTEIEEEYEEPEVTEEALEKELDELREKRATMETVEDPEAVAQEGSYVVINFQGYMDGEAVEEAKAEEYLLELGSGSFIEGFEEKIVGAQAGDELQISVTFPDDYGREELAGQEVSFAVEVIEIKEKVLPELDDELAREMGDYEDLQELKNELENNLQQEASQNARSRFREKALTSLLDMTEIDIPSTMVESRIDQLISQLEQDLQSRDMNLEQYLQATGLTEDELRDTFRERAERDISADLALDCVAENEGIEAEDDDLDAEVEMMAASYGQSPEALKQFMLTEQNKRQMAESIKRQKAMKFLEEIAKNKSKEKALESLDQEREEKIARAEELRTAVEEYRSQQSEERGEEVQQEEEGELAEDTGGESPANAEE